MQGYIGLVMEYYPENLETILSKLDDIAKLKIALRVANSMQKLHKSSITHRNLHPHNILVIV